MKMDAIPHVPHKMKRSELQGRVESMALQIQTLTDIANNLVIRISEMEFVFKKWSTNNPDYITRDQLNWALERHAKNQREELERLQRAAKRAAITKKNRKKLA